ncbi:MAG: hypothetical protein BMS9Abin05_2408 [Rhodothermia bacterium]|nr:MAG: hypothetical protein BMS9Abin05_2408 [Rhodothermia bacterium]
MVGSVFASIFKQLSDHSRPSKIHRFTGFDLCGIEPRLVPERERGQDFGEGHMYGNFVRKHFGFESLTDGNRVGS